MIVCEGEHALGWCIELAQVVEADLRGVLGGVFSQEVVDPIIWQGTQSLLHGFKSRTLVGVFVQSKGHGIDGGKPSAPAGEPGRARS